MSPTVFRYKSYRFFFFSREESRMHIHISCPQGEAKYWIEPKVALAENYQLSLKQLNELQKIVEDHKNEIKESWKKHFHR
jgi:hypothetical protein